MSLACDRGNKVPCRDLWTKPALERETGWRLSVSEVGRIVESGPEGDRVPHVRLRRDTVHLWLLEVRGRTWESTPYRATMDGLVDLLATELGWVLAPRA